MLRLRYFLGCSDDALGAVVDELPVEALGVLEDELPEALGEVVLEPLPLEAVLPEALPAACSDDESLPSLSLSSDENCCSSEVPFASSREIEPSLFLSSVVNEAPALAEAPMPDVPAEVLPDVPAEVLPEVEALGVLVLVPALALGEAVLEPELEVLSPEANAAVEKAAAHAAAMRVFISICESPQ